MGRLGAAALAAIVALQPLIAAAEQVGRRAVLVLDANTGRVLYEIAADAPRYPASLTKLMTLYILFEQIEEGRLSLTSKIRFSAHAVSMPPSRLEVEEGTEIEVIDAIKVLITKSANDVAVAIAERIAGSEERFAELMNRKARELGMTSTAFQNASGLPDPDQVTTARDILTLALKLQDRFPKYYPLFSTRFFTWGGETYRNHNRLLFSYRGLDGMKTGYTRASGFNVVASARRGQKHVMVAYFGGATAGLRNAAVRARLDAAFLKASVVKTRRAAPVFTARAKAPAAAVQAKAVPAPALAKAPRIAMAAIAPEAEEPPADAAPSPGAAKALPAPEPADAPTPAEQVAVADAIPAGAFQVQIGAFKTQGEAERQLATVRERAGSVLGAHVPQMTQVKLGAKTLFRARYVGFPAKAAAAGVCDELKRLEIDCLVMKAE